MHATVHTQLAKGLLLGLSLAAASSQAASTWQQNGSGNCLNSQVNVSGATFGNTCRLNGADTYADVTAWSNTGTGGKFETAKLAAWDGSGFGTYNRNPGGVDTGETVSPEHAVDNSTFTDAVAYSFGKSVTLDSVTIGWSADSTGSSSSSARDADISVLAYTGPGSWTGSLTGASVSDLLTKGWSLVGNFANVDDMAPSGSGGTVGFSTTISSSWWLVTAYNSAFGSGAGLEGGNDYFKLLKVTGTPTTPPDTSTGVPEPGMLALLGLAGLAAFAARRRRG